MDMHGFNGYSCMHGVIPAYVDQSCILYRADKM